MAKRGRKSINERMTPNITGAPSRITAPTTLTAREKKLFVEVVNACAADHFRMSDVPVLENYVRATLLTRDLAEKLGSKTLVKTFPLYEKAVRLQLSSATKLRLTPSTRTHPEKIARQNPNGFANGDKPPPWMRKDEAAYSRDELDDADAIEGSADDIDYGDDHFSH